MPAFTDASVTLVIGIVKKFFMMIGFSGASLQRPHWHCQVLLAVQRYYDGEVIFHPLCVLPQKPSSAISALCTDTLKPLM